MIRIIQGDCRDVLACLPGESVHCVVTSPPYWGLRDYGAQGQMGLEPTIDKYVSNMVDVFRDVRRVLRKDGTLWLNLGDSYASGPSGAMRPSNLNGGTAAQRIFRLVSDAKSVPEGLKPKDLVGIPWRVAFALQADGWWLRQDIIWSKPNPMPESVADRPTGAHEYLFLLTKSARYFYDAEAIKEKSCRAGDIPGGGHKHAANDVNDMRTRKGLEIACQMPVASSRNKRSVWEIATTPFREAHFATFPPALVEPCIRAGTSERGCCAKCGAPWERSGRRAQIDRGWSPSCSCNAQTVACTVLDPFAGAGTVGLVADRLQRDAILVDLNPDYSAMAARRIHADAPLFTRIDQ